MQQCSECGVVALMAPWSGLCWNMWDWPSVSTFRVDRRWQRRHPGPVTRSFHASLPEVLFHACQSGVAVSYQDDEVDSECCMVPPDPIARAKALGWVQHPNAWSIPGRDGNMHCHVWRTRYVTRGWHVSSICNKEHHIDAGPDEADAVALALLLWDTVLM